MMMDALADGGVYAGVPKDIALKLTAYTMIVSCLWRAIVISCLNLTIIMSENVKRTQLSLQGSAEMVLLNGMHPQEVLLIMMITVLICYM